MAEDDEIVSLVNLGNRAAIALFDAELKKVLANILDINMQESPKRTITLKVSIKPLADRGIGAGCDTGYLPGGDAGEPEFEQEGFYCRAVDLAVV